MRVGSWVKWLFILPGFLIIFFVVLYPTIYLLYYSFTDYSLDKSVISFVGIDNYVKLLQDQFFINSVYVTFRFAVMTIPIEFALGLAIALCITRIRNERIHGILYPLSIAPVMLTPVVIGMLWLILLNPDYGLLNTILKSLRIPPIAFVSDPFWAPIAVALADIWQWTPFFIMISVAGIYAIRPEIIEAAEIDGAHGLLMIKNIILPMIKPLLVFALLIRLIDVFKVYDVIYIMTYGGPGISTEVLSFRIWKIAFLERNIGYASAWGVVLLLMMIFLANVLILAIRKVRM
ncbi:MAG: sugar ABC transporter permease [Desulfurococcaceae archaeon]